MTNAKNIHIDDGHSTSKPNRDIGLTNAMGQQNGSVSQKFKSHLPTILTFTGMLANSLILARVT